jgi:hypothetical protein
MFDITLYGHLVVDTVYDTDTTVMEFGGIANMRRAFDRLAPKLNLGLVPTVLGSADIFIDRATSSRSSRANLNTVRLPVSIKPSRISHVLYLNELPNVDFVSQLPGIITADCCKGKPVDLDLLKYIDYLFVSDDEVADLESVKRATKGTVIVHSPQGSRIFKDDKETVYSIDPSLMITNANVLGAGDMFAACFLFALHNNFDNGIEYAHTKTAELLREINEKI